jgi:hypothetical protein
MSEKEKGDALKRTPNLEEPPLTRSMSKKEREGALKRTPSLEEPSPTITTCLEIDVACACCNATHTFYL